MKALPLLVLALALVAAPLHARLGESRDQLIARFGAQHVERSIFGLPCTGWSLPGGLIYAVVFDGEGHSLIETLAATFPEKISAAQREKLLTAHAPLPEWAERVITPMDRAVDIGELPFGFAPGLDRIWQQRGSDLTAWLSDERKLIVFASPGAAAMVADRARTHPTVDF